MMGETRGQWHMTIPPLSLREEAEIREWIATVEPIGTPTETARLLATLDAVRDMAQEYFEATLPLLNDYPLTDSERQENLRRLRLANTNLRAALHREDGA